MGFFQDLKEDLSLAVNELLPEDEANNKAVHEKEAEEDESVENAKQEVEAALSAEFIENKDDSTVDADSKVKDEDKDNTLEEDLIKALQEEYFDEPDASDSEENIPDLMGLEEEATNKETDTKAEKSGSVQSTEDSEQNFLDKNDDHKEVTEVKDQKNQQDQQDQKDTKNDEMNSAKNDQDKTGSMEPLMEAAAAQIASIAHIVSKDEVKVDRTEDEISEEDYEERRLQTPEELLSNINHKGDETEIEKEVKKAMADQKMNLTDEDVADETAVITAGMGITGDITSRGSLEVLGKVKGNIEVLGKLNVSGNIEGDSKAAEVFADSAHVTGMIKADGTVKIGQNSVIIGNISASSAVIAGAVKGDIDVMGPVILDASAVVMGNIKSKSVQINNGAVIEGMCSQCYAEVNPTSFFEQLISK